MCSDLPSVLRPSSGCITRRLGRRWCSWLSRTRTCTSLSWTQLRERPSLTPSQAPTRSTWWWEMPRWRTRSYGTWYVNDVKWLCGTKQFHQCILQLSDIIKKKFFLQFLRRRMLFSSSLMKRLRLQFSPRTFMFPNQKSRFALYVVITLLQEQIQWKWIVLTLSERCYFVHYSAVLVLCWGLVTKPWMLYLLLLCVCPAYVPRAREKTSYCPVQHLHRTRPLSLPAAAHPGIMTFLF